jgi:hypothetical protein
MADPSKTLYKRAVDISEDYLGPAGERFMRRQISTHLGKEPGELDKKDIDELVNWVRLTFALLTDDSRMIDAFSERLTLLGEGEQRTARKRSAKAK